MEFTADCITRLAEIVGRPEAAGEVFDWAAVEASVGLPLPTDYNKLIEHFPEGRFRGVLGLVRPVVEEGGVEFLWYFHRLRLDGMHEAWQEDPARLPYPIYPEPGGLLPCATTVDGYYYFWLTESSDPNSWPIIVAYNNNTSWIRHDKNLCLFLTDVVTGDVDVTAYGLKPVSQPGFVVHMDPPRQVDPARYIPWRDLVSAAPKVRIEFSALQDIAGDPRSMYVGMTGPS